MKKRLVLGNYGIHKTQEMKTLLAKNQRFHLHFTPISASWLNLVERFFAEITTNRIPRGAFASVAELEDQLRLSLPGNAAPKTLRLAKGCQCDPRQRMSRTRRGH